MFHLTHKQLLLSLIRKKRLYKESEKKKSQVTESLSEHM